jgi:hypothetical protein
VRRNPNDPQDSDYTGYDFWLTKLNQFGGNYINAEMVKAFMVSHRANDCEDPWRLRPGNTQATGVHKGLCLHLVLRLPSSPRALLIYQVAIQSGCR